MKLGFKNFRRFSNLTPIEFGNVTYLVGRNNAGKSTLVKALILIQDFLSSNQIDKFSLEGTNLEDTNVVTFDRAKNKNTTDDYIEFVHELKYLEIRIRITGQPGQTEADVLLFSIEDIFNGIQVKFEPAISHITISSTYKSTKFPDEFDFSEIEELEENVKNLDREIKQSSIPKTSKEYINKIEELKDLKGKLKIKKKASKGKPAPEQEFSISGQYEKGQSLVEIIESFVSETLASYEQEYIKIQQGKRSGKAFANLQLFKANTEEINRIIPNLNSEIKQANLIYVGVSPSKQSSLFSIRDRNNPLAKVIHEFAQLKLTKGQPAMEFALKWMKAFEIGDSFELALHAGEAYEVLIDSNGTKISLADMGMGSMQAMLIILKITCAVHRWVSFQNTDIRSDGLDEVREFFNKPNIRIVVEEPEINLHPALQSRLTDLFTDAAWNYKIKFLVETHSEYMIRRSQVLVAAHDLESEFGTEGNTFSVFYFPGIQEQEPYQLDFNQDGTFIQNFGKGFFDEASTSTLELIRLKRLSKY